MSYRLPPGSSSTLLPVPVDALTRDLLTLTLTPGLGPVLIARLLETFGSPDRVLAAPASQLRAVRGLGAEKAQAVAKGFAAADAHVAAELALADRLGVTIIARGTPAFPPLLAQIPDPPPLLYVRGSLDASGHGLDRFTLAIVGSRKCSHYGTEQAERFAAALAAAGVTVVSGGARGIDTAAHRAALRVGGRTVAVLGCGLARCYPPENQALFDQIAGARAPGAPGASSSACGAVLSELPLNTPPNAENFPARNRLISGLSLGVLVVEAARSSGALITARQAAEDHGRDVFALPHRVDSTTAEGSLHLLKSGGAALATEPGDLLAELDGLAGRLHAGAAGDDLEPGLFPAPRPEPGTTVDPRPASTQTPAAPSLLNARQRAILDALAEPRTIDELAQATGADPAALRAELTVLELRRAIRRVGSRLVRSTAG